MNGVDSEELIAAQVGAAHVLPALIKVASHRTEDGVRFDPETTIGIIYGELTHRLTVTGYRRCGRCLRTRTFISV